MYIIRYIFINLYNFNTLQIIKQITLIGYIIEQVYILSAIKVSLL